MTKRQTYDSDEKDWSDTNVTDNQLENPSKRIRIWG